MSDPRADMVAAAVDLIARNGVAGTSIGDVLKAAGAPRGSVYHHFPGGRAELFAEAVLLSAEFVDDALGEAVRSSPAYIVNDIAAMWRRILTDSEFAAGSTVLAAATARGTDPMIAAIAERQFTRWEELLAASLRSKGFSNDVARPLALTVLSAVDGAVIRCRAHRSLEPLDAVVQQIGPLLVPAG